MPHKKRFSAQISCPVTLQQKRELEQIAVDTNHTVSDLLREAIDSYLQGHTLAKIALTNTGDLIGEMAQPAK